MAGEAGKRPDVKLLFGVHGDTSISGDSSGALIKKQLEEIAKKISEHPIKIKFQVEGLEVNKNGAKKSIEKEAENMTAGMRSYYQALNTVEKRLQSLSIASSKYKFTGGAEFDEARAKLEKMAQRYESLRQEVARGELTQDEYRNSLAQLDLRMTQSIRTFKEYEAAQKNASKAIVNAPSFASQFGSALGNQVSGIANSLSGRLLGTYGLMKGAHAVLEMIQTSIDLESQMAELQIVTRVTDQEFVNYGDDVAKTAQEVSASISDLISATTTYSRLGYSLDESSMLAKYTGMLEKVGNIDAEEAENAVTSILKAFSNEIDVSNAESMMDRLVVVGNNFPISVEQIALGMTNASSALAAAGNDFNQTVALLAAANATIQDASKSSTGLRTIAARIRNTKTELDALGEEVIAQAKYEELINTLTDHKVTLVNELTGEYRSTYDVLRDIANVWDEMSSMEQAAVTTNIAGTRQQAVFASIIQQFKDPEHGAEAAVRAMEGSLGELTDAYSIYQETTQAKIETLNAAWDKLSMDVTDSAFNQSLIGIATTFVNIADSLAKMNMLLPAIIGVVGAIKTVQALIKASQLTRHIEKTITGLIAGGAAATSEADAVKKLTIEEKKLATAMLMQQVAQGKVTAEAAEGIIANYGLAASEGAAATGATALGTALKGMMLSNPLGWIVGGISLVASLAIAFGGLADSADDATDAMEHIKETTSEVQQTLSDFQSLKQNADDIIPRYVELHEKLQRTNEEEEEFHKLQNKIAEMFPELNAGLDANGNYMVNLAGDANTLTAALMAQVEAQRMLANQEVASGFGEFAANLSSIGNQRNAAEDMYHYFADPIAEYEAKGMTDYVDVFTQKAATAKQKLDALSQSYQSALSSGRTIFSAWLQTTGEYSSSSSALQQIALAALGNLSFGSLDDFSEEGIKNFIRERIIDPLLNMAPEAQEAVESMFGVHEDFKNGKTTAGYYTEQINDITMALKEAGLSWVNIKKIKDSFGVDEFSDELDTIRKNLVGDSEAVDKFVNSLTSDQLVTVFDILKDGEMTIEGLNAALERSTHLGTEFADVFNFGELFGGLDKATKNIDKVASAMKKLNEGTALVTSELMELAEQFPELLKQSNLFTDGSVAGQKKMLQEIVKVNEQEYKAHLEMEIAKAEATDAVLKKQLELEKEKAALILQIAAWEVRGRVEEEGELNAAKAQLRALDSQNFVEITGNQVTVNAKALQDMLDNQEKYTKKSVEYWATIAHSAWDVITATEAERMMDPEYADKQLDEFIRKYGSEKGIGAYRAYAERIEGYRRTAAYEQKSASRAVADAIKDVKSAKGTIDTKVLLGTDYQKIYDETQRRIKLIEASIGDNATLKKNLEDLLKKSLLDIMEPADKGSSGKSSSDAERELKEKQNELLSTLKDFYDNQKKLLQAQRDAEKFANDEAEKRKKVTDLQMQLEQMKQDDSAYAAKLRAELTDKLVKAQKELDDFEKDHAVKTVQSQLDDLYNEQKAQIEATSEAINKSLNDPKALFNKALADIKTNTDALYKALAEQEQKSSATTNKAVVDMFARAIAALLRGEEVDAENLLSGVGYASGTSYASRGLHPIDESGIETIFESADGRRYKLFTGGEKVLDASASDFLYRFAASHGRMPTGEGLRVSGNSGNVPMIRTGDIIINGNADERTVSEIRRAQRDNMEMLLRELTRLSR